MNNKEEERRCKSCGKLLLDEKMPFCRRCLLEGRDKVGKIGGIIGGVAMTVLSAASLIANNTSDSVNDNDIP